MVRIGEDPALPIEDAPDGLYLVWLANWQRVKPCPPNPMWENPLRVRDEILRDLAAKVIGAGC